MDRTLPIELALALPDRQWVLALDVSPGTTATQVLVHPSLPDDFVQQLPACYRLGIFGKALDDPGLYILQAGDRLEIYRPLLIDPKEARRQRAERARGRGRE